MQIASQMTGTVFKNNYLILTIYRSCLSRLDKLEGVLLQILLRYSPPGELAETTIHTRGVIVNIQSLVN